VTVKAHTPVRSAIRIPHDSMLVYNSFSRAPASYRRVRGSTTGHLDTLGLVGLALADDVLPPQRVQTPAKHG